MGAPLDGLDAVDWDALTHAYGPATDVPAMLRALRDPATAEDTLDWLGGTIFHQGSIYTATPPTLAFLATLAVGEATPARAALVAFIAEMGPAVLADHDAPDLLGERGRHLPAGLDLAAFTRTARAAYAAACEALSFCLDDLEAGVRAAVANAWRALDPLPDSMVAAMARRLAVECDATAIGALAGALAAAGRLTEADREIVARSAPAARLAAACIAAQTRRALDPRDLATLCAMWTQCSRSAWDEPRLLDLVQARRAALLPLVDDLAARPEPRWRVEAIGAYLELARLSRGATDAAKKGLVQLALRVAAASAPPASDDRISDEMATKLAGAHTLTAAMRELATHRPDAAALETRARRDLVAALVQLLPLDGDGSRPIGDALMALAQDDPDVRQDAAQALCDIGDERWATLVERAALSGTPVPWIVPLIIAAARREDDVAALAAALDVVRDALRRDAAGNAGHLWSLRDLPDEVLRPLLPEVVVALPFAVRPACTILARWKAPETAAPLRRALAAADAEHRPWLHATLATVTGDAHEFDRGWATRPDRFFDEHGYLSAWSTLPTEVLQQTCRSRLTGIPAPRPDRDAQLLVCRLMLPIDGLAGIWPTLRALVDCADMELHEAVALAISALRRSPDTARRADLVALLDDIRCAGRRTPLGVDLDAPVEAAIGLQALGAGAAAALAETCVATLISISRLSYRPATISRACALLGTLARAEQSLRDVARRCFTDLLAADDRVSYGGKNLIGADEAFGAALRQAIADL